MSAENYYAIWCQLRDDGFNISPSDVAAVCLARESQRSKDLLYRLRSLSGDAACIKGTPMVPLHKDTIREIVSALESA